MCVCKISDIYVCVDTGLLCISTVSACPDRKNSTGDTMLGLYLRAFVCMC